MAAAKFSHHDAMKSRLLRALVPSTQATTGVFVEPSVTLAEDTFVEPDIAVWPSDIGSQDVRGPDLLLVIEVAVSSIAYDLKVKARLYAEAGVRDYRVVDALRRTVRVHRGPDGGGYTDVHEYSEDEPIAVAFLPGVAIRLDRVD